MGGWHSQIKFKFQKCILRLSFTTLQLAWLVQQSPLHCRLRKVFLWESGRRSKAISPASFIDLFLSSTEECCQCSTQEERRDTPRPHSIGLRCSGTLSGCGRDGCQQGFGESWTNGGGWGIHVVDAIWHFGAPVLLEMFSFLEGGGEKIITSRVC